MQPSEVFIHLSNLGGIAISGMFLYLAWGFDRVFSPHLFLSGLLLVGFRRYRFAAVLVVTNLVFIGSFLNRFGQYWSGDFTADPAAFTAQQAEVAQYIAYDSAASSPWCNTLLLDVRLYDSRVLTVPGGIGVSYVLRPDTLQFPLKSRYLLFNSPADLDLYTRLQSRLNVRLLGRLSIGDLYLNQDADC